MTNQLWLELRRSWRSIGMLAALHFGALIAVPLALLSVGAAFLFVAPLVGGAAVEALRLAVRQRLRRALRERCLEGAARAALDKIVPIPEANVDSAFWAAHMLEYAVSADAPAIAGSSLAAIAILALSWLRLGFDVVMPVILILLVGVAIVLWGNRSRTRAVDAIVARREATAALVTAAERDFGEIHGPSARAPYLGELRRETALWCDAESLLERRHFVQRLGLGIFVFGGFALVGHAHGLNPLAISAGTSLTVQGVSDLLLLGTILPVGSVLADHVESFLVVHAALKKTHQLSARAEVEGRRLPRPRPRRLTARQLTFRYGEEIALDLGGLDLDLDLPCLLMGPNGAGKTTFGALLTGVFFPTSGELTIDGVPCAEIDRDLLAFVPQNPLIVETLSIQANVRLVAPLAEPEAITRLLLRLGLDKPLETPAGHLSKGEQRRIAFARALLKDPALLVLDEPDAWLDEGGRRVLLEIVHEEAARRAVFLISHRAEFGSEGFRVVTLTARHQLGDAPSRTYPIVTASQPSGG